MTPPTGTLAWETVLIGAALDVARADGAWEFDFLRGSEPYRYAWGAVDHPLLRLDLPPGRPHQGGFRVLPGGLAPDPAAAPIPSHAA